MNANEFKRVNDALINTNVTIDDIVRYVKDSAGVNDNEDIISIDVNVNDNGNLRIIAVRESINASTSTISIDVDVEDVVEYKCLNDNEVYESCRKAILMLHERIKWLRDYYIGAKDGKEYIVRKTITEAVINASEALKAGLEATDSAGDD